MAWTCGRGESAGPPAGRLRIAAPCRRYGVVGLPFIERCAHAAGYDDDGEVAFGRPGNGAAHGLLRRQRASIGTGASGSSQLTSST